MTYLKRGTFLPSVLLYRIRLHLVPVSHHYESIQAGQPLSWLAKRAHSLPGQYRSTFFTTGMSEFETKAPDQGGRFCFIRWSC